MKILFAASECVPFVKTGGLADVVGALPKQIRKSGEDVRVILPLYSAIDQKWRDQMEHVVFFYINLGWRRQYVGIEKLVYDDITFYFVDNKQYFQRNYIYGLGGDEGERYTYFCRAVLEALPQMGFIPDVLHCHDWQTGLMPMLLNAQYKHLEPYSKIKTVFTIHNLQYQGIFSISEIEELVSLGDWAYTSDNLEFYGMCSMMKGGIVGADRITTVSPTYAQEIQTAYYGERLDGLIRSRVDHLSGILNGIDTDEYNPATDPAIAKHYTTNNYREGKAACKAALQDEFGLHKDGSPVMAMVTRLVGHKGVDLVQAIAEGLLQQGIELVILGSGEAQYENYFNELCARNPGRVGVYIGFNAKLAQQIYAGADIFLMPSRSEPCGLAQMVSCRYGTIPVIRETGGLKDSIRDSGDGYGNGFTFANYNAHELYEACWRAKEGYWQKDGWPVLVKRAMECDFSWSNSAKSYEGLYNEVVNLW